MTGALAEALPVALVAALAVRPRGEIEQETVTPALRGADVAAEEVRLRRQALRKPEVPFVVDGATAAVLAATRLGDDTVLADVRCEVLPAQPGLSVVWAPAGGAEGGPLPEGATVLGLLAPWATTSLPLPVDRLQDDGVLQLYSLDHGALVGEAVDLPGLPQGLEAMRALSEEDLR